MALEAVLAASLGVGAELDRGAARKLNQARRRHEAMAKAARALGHRDLSEKELADRLARSRVSPAARDETLERLTGAGAVDDGRFARQRAELLAERGGGDALIRHDLVSRGIREELIEAALEELPAERERAARIVDERKPSPRTARYLARKGFSHETIESVCEGTIA